MKEQEIKNILRSKSLKATSARLNLLTQMSEYKSAMPSSTIQRKLKSLDRVTLYRTIESLKEHGIIHKAYQENNESYYALCGSRCSHNHHNHDHIHFKCVKCDAVTCEKMGEEFEINLPKKQLYKLNVYAEGVCDNCVEVN